MPKTILITGATDGIGLETAKMLRAKNHHLLLHGRNPAKLDKVVQTLAQQAGSGSLAPYAANLSKPAEVTALVKAVRENHASLDVLINNAGVFKTNEPVTAEGFDVRFVVNTLAPYVLAKNLLPSLGSTGRVVNLSSAAQAPVDPRALNGEIRLSDFDAYAQSKLAITMWSAAMAASVGEAGPVIVSVNPGSMLGTNMVRDAFGVAGGSVQIGADILCRAALGEAFANASGRYWDNDAGRFAPPYADAQDPQKNQSMVAQIEAALDRWLQKKES